MEAKTKGKEEFEVIACASFVIRISDKAYVIHFGDTEITTYGGSDKKFNTSSYNCQRDYLDLLNMEKDQKIEKEIGLNTKELITQKIQDVCNKFHDYTFNHDKFSEYEIELLKSMNYYKYINDPGFQICVTNVRFSDIHFKARIKNAIKVIEIPDPIAILCSDGIYDNLEGTSYNVDQRLASEVNKKNQQDFFNDAIKNSITRLGKDWIETIDNDNIMDKCDQLSVEVHNEFYTYFNSLGLNRLGNNGCCIGRKEDDTIIAIIPLCTTDELKELFKNDFLNN